MIDHQLSRREIVALAGAGLVAASGVAPAQSPQPVFAYVGSWTQGPFGVGGGGGIMSFAINLDDSSITHVNTRPSMGINPAYVTIDATGSHVLVSNHGSYNVVVTVVERDGVAEIQRAYDDGTVSIYPVRPDGTLAPASDVAVLERISGVDLLSQFNPQAHS